MGVYDHNILFNTSSNSNCWQEFTTNFSQIQYWCDWGSPNLVQQCFVPPTNQVKHTLERIAKRKNWFALSHHIFARKSFKVPRSSLKTLQCYCRTFRNEVSCRFINDLQSNCSKRNQSRSSKLHPFSPATNNVHGMSCVSQLISAYNFGIHVHNYDL